MCAVQVLVQCNLVTTCLAWGSAIVSHEAVIEYPVGVKSNKDLACALLYFSDTVAALRNYMIVFIDFHQEVSVFAITALQP